MNTKKGKGKNRPNKPPNPNPPQTVESAKTPEKLDELVVENIESALNVEERVPEIVSEVVTPAEVGVKSVEEPRKPKRNRGKKKKHDKDEVEESGDDKTAENVEELPTKITPTTAEDSKLELIENKPAEKPAEMLNVAPTARKKKNKNKNVNAEQTTKEPDNILKIEEAKEVLPVEVSGANVETKREISTKPVEEMKPANKKNKKKKRHDSEKSDKAEEISCTAAFQQLLSAGDEKPENKETVSEIKTEMIPEVIPEVKTIQEEGTADENVSKGNKNKKKGKKDKHNAPKEEIKEEVQQSIESVSVTLTEEKDDLKSDINKPQDVVTKKLEEKQLLSAGDEKPDMKETVSEIKTEMIPEVIPEVKTIQEEGTADENVSKGNKNKKKGKKDKHNAPKEEIKEEVLHSIESFSVTLIEEKDDLKSDINKPQDVVTEKLEENKEIPVGTLKETKPVMVEDVKPKAKIAKPVDKKRKEQSNQEIKECEAENVNIPEAPKSENLTAAVAACEIKDPIVEQAKSEEVQLTEKTIEPKDASTTSLPELITLPQSHMGKKRKKSPKPPRQQETKIETEKPEVSETKEEEGTKSEKILMEMATSERVKEQIFEETPKHKILETPIEIMSAPEFTEEPEIESNKESASAEATSTINLEVKPGKKRKKSPKPMSKIEITKENEPVIKETESKTKTAPPVEAINMPEEPVKQMKTVASGEGKSDIFYTPQTQDIEISSVKGEESEGSIPDIVPDVQYPRAASQQRVDNNNNTIIREVATPSDVKLGVPLFIPDTPLIQGGDIPLTSPEMVASGIRVLDVGANVVKPNEEKTDIKSKMMEVNQDMEELRLSIERSLAELTSMEKSEKSVEKKYEGQIKNKPEETKPAPASVPNVMMESNKAIGEESQTTESEILKVEKKTLEAIMPAPVPPRKGNKKEISPQTEALAKTSLSAIPLPPPLPKEEQSKPITEETKQPETLTPAEVPPVCPARKDNKGKGKSKKKGKQETVHTAASGMETTSISSEVQATKESSQATKTEEKKEQKTDKSEDNTKKQSDIIDDGKGNDNNTQEKSSSQVLTDFEPIESFEDAMTSSADDVNKSFEMIVDESAGSHVNPEINIIAPAEDTKSDSKDEKKSPVSPPKNLLGHPVIPARSNRMDYKKEKNKTPNTILAKVKIKDSIEIESKKQSKESQTENIKKMTEKKSIDESISTLNENEEFVYKYSFRKVFLPSVCHVCKKELKPMRVSCNYCHLLFYCSQKHKDDDWAQHQAFCFAVSTIAHLKNQKHIYEDAAGITGHNYRLLRMQMIVSCEKILKRKLLPSEQEALLYPRLCGDWRCREYRLNKLVDCNGCGQIAFCSSDPDHLPKSHQRWCKSYSLYQKLVCYQQTRGRLEPKLPSRAMSGYYQIPDKINEVLAAMYEEKIDMNDVEYAALTQLATAPLTAVYSFQIYTNKMNSIYANGTYKKTSFTVHVVGAELQFEADALNKWEIFFMHLRPDIVELRVSLVAPDLNPSNLPLDLLGKVKLCDQCRQDKRRLLFSFQDKKTYSEYYKSDDFTTPDIVCAFNPSIQRSSVYNGKDPWPATVGCVLKQKVPFIITSYTLEELRRDLGRVKECEDFNVVSEPKYNTFASVRPDRNFITDDEIPLLFKNHCFAVVTGVF